MPRVEKMKTVLFLCTGNYYRSRFAEELFNHRTGREGVQWIAQSRGLAIERGVHNIGALSRFARTALSERGISLRGGERLPQQCKQIDLQTADRIVALYEAEHRPLMLERFPAWEDRTEFWQIQDVEFVSPKDALGEIEKQIDALLRRLSA
jgi:protein-tyrosine phosphatase